MIFGLIMPIIKGKCKMSFSHKLALCRGLKFAMPTRSVSAKDIQVSFEQAYRLLEVSALPEGPKIVAKKLLFVKIVR